MSTSVASVVQHFPDAENGFTTSLSATIASGATTVGLNSVAGYTNGEPAVFVVDPSDVTKKQTFTGIIDTSGVQVTSVVWTAGTNQTHTGGATVVDYATATHIAMMSKGIKVNHTQKGNHKTLTDDNANEWIGLTTTGSAVNYVNIANSATTNAPIISAKGDDATINLNLQGKGLAKTVTIGAGAATIYPYDYVASGCVWTADNVGVNLNASMTAGVVVINGNPVTVALVTARAFTTNVDTYIDVLDNGDGTGLLVYTTAATNAASAALAANSVRIGIIQAAATITATTKVNQGQEDKVFPIASSIPYAVTDSLGNLICPRDPQRKVLGYRQIIVNFTTASATAVQITGLSCPVIIPTGRKIQATVALRDVTNTVGVTSAYASIWDGTVGSGTQLNDGALGSTLAAANYFTGGLVQAVSTPSATSKTYNAGLRSTAANSITAESTSTAIQYIKIELN